MKHFSRQNESTQGKNKAKIWIKQPLNDNFVKSDSFPEQVLEKILRICYNIGVSSAHTYSIRKYAGFRVAAICVGYICFDYAVHSL